MIALAVRGIVKSFGGVRAIDDVSFEIDDGMLTAIIGPNGAGKTTLFNLFTNLYRPDAGSVLFFGTALDGRRSDAIARLGLVRTFQTARVFAGMSVLENVLAGAHVTARRPAVAHALRLPSARHEERLLVERADALLGALDLVAWRDRPAADVPLGIQKLVELARALIARPRMLLLDEPAAGLNDAETDELARVLVAIHRAGTSVVVVEHNMSLVMGIADRVVVLDAGRLIANGTPSEIRADAAVVAAYVGRETGASR